MGAKIRKLIEDATKYDCKKRKSNLKRKRRNGAKPFLALSAWRAVWQDDRLAQQAHASIPVFYGVVHGNSQEKEGVVCNGVTGLHLASTNVDPTRPAAVSRDEPFKISRDSPLGSLANDKHTSPPSKSHGRKHRVRLPRRALVGSQDRAATQIVVKELDFCLRGLDFMTRGTPALHSQTPPRKPRLQAAYKVDKHCRSSPTGISSHAGS
ncbi:hypothetical protein CISG_03722 [Coccidioides immitis RMSCC 3703]|uniref:Uncharacterized protein n=1 Tax=Coccidioides immitis RMSCC 3703 TaxID=454286 RepID=A0A0J8QMJ4_COCIT|nr:hypothetical protein CISG_03722 [Coccidioides immitis RMSCC 3703]